MKRLIASAPLTAFPVIAQTPPIQVAIGCDKKDNVVVIVKANEPGQVAFMIPKNVCGVDT